MNDYEILIMLDPELPEERQGEIVQRVREIIEKSGGTWVATQGWGRRRLAYEIDKKNEGAYHLVAFDSEPAALDEATRVLKITDGVMRHMATRRIAVPGRPPPPAAVGAGGAEEYSAPSESETEGGA